MKVKKYILIVASLFLMLGSVSATVIKGACGTNLIYSLDTESGVLEIVGSGKMVTKNTEYIPWQKYKPLITTIVLPNGLLTIGDYAFQDCINLTSVKIPTSVIAIGMSAFDGCDKLININVPKQVTRICKYAFRGITNVNYNGSEKRYGPWGAKSLNGYIDGILVYSDKSKSRLRACYRKAKGIIVIPAGVKMIDDYAFCRCIDITSIVIPNSVKKIGLYAFADCENLTSVTLSNNLKTIGARSFASCTRLQSIELPNSINSIETGTFSRCASLTHISIPNSVRTISDEAFMYCISLDTIVLPSSLKSIGLAAFYGCSSLSSLKIPQSVSSIKTNAFCSVKNVIYSGPANGFPWGAGMVNNLATHESLTSEEPMFMAPKVPKKPINSSSISVLNNKPTCAIISPMTGSIYNTPSIRMRYIATADPGLNYIVRFSVDGNEVKPMQAGKTKNAQVEQGVEVELPMPTNNINRETIISIQVKDDSGAWSDPSTITLKYVNEKKPSLHIFAVGISDYPASDLQNLNYAAKDAQDFVQTISESDLEMYKEVKQHLIMNKDAKAAILRTRLTELSQRVSQDDVVMLYFSGHGINQNDEKYFITYDASAEEYYNGLSFEFIKRRMLDMVAKHCRVIVFMDACHSGAMFGIKGSAKEITFATPGVIGFYSSTANEKSAEMEKLQNGVFTNVLLSGLKGGAVNKEGQITIQQLSSFISNQVSDKTDGKQTPIVENPVGDAVLFRIKKK